MQNFKALFPLLLLFFSFSTLAQKMEIKLDHYAILVQDLDKSCDFYQKIIGLKEIEDQTKKDHIRWFSMGKKAELHIIESKEYKIPDEKGVHLALRTANLDAFIEHLRANKIPFQNWYGEDNTTNDRPDGIRQVYLTDLDGYWIEINGK